MVFWEPQQRPQDVQQGAEEQRVGPEVHLQHDRDMHQSRQPDAGYVPTLKLTPPIPPS